MFIILSLIFNPEKYGSIPINSYWVISGVIFWYVWLGAILTYQSTLLTDVPGFLIKFVLSPNLFISAVKITWSEVCAKLGVYVPLLLKNWTLAWVHPI